MRELYCSLVYLSYMGMAGYVSLELGHAGEIDDLIKRGTKRGRVDCALVASQPQRRRRATARVHHHDAVAAAGLEDD
jgi:hypothetical protein